jgi:class 3 adenylate cyclase
MRKSSTFTLYSKKSAAQAVDLNHIHKLAKESKISKILSELITKKVIILILTMLLILPMISDDFISDSEATSYYFFANYLENYNNLNNSLNASNNFWNSTISMTDYFYPIINITINNALFYHNTSYDHSEIRETDILFASSYEGNVNIIYSIFTDTNLTGILNIAKTCYVCILLTLAAIYFEKDTKQLILEPLEVMIEIVENVAKDPINAKNTEQVQEGFKNTLSKLSAKKKKRKEEQADTYEVKIIQAAIVKISALLAIGFGEAGGEIIRENITNHQNLDPMLKGKRKTAIFGFCDIRLFAEINEILQEKTMVFVNEIADIVHSSVDRFGGAANKNIGDSFLLVWQMNNNLQNNEILDENGSIKLVRKGSKNSITTVNNSQMADFALLSFLKILIRLNRDPRILDYRNHPGILTSLSGQKIAMGFGLHIGWAIEGAIGSSFKIDASYLSPNVNMAARLKSATEQYGVILLISGEFFDYLSEDMKRTCRHIDTAVLKGCKNPTRLYTIDVNLDLKPSTRNYNKYTPEQKTKIYEFKKAELINDLEAFGYVSDLILRRKNFKKLIKGKMPKGFHKLHRKAMKHYIEGNWEKAVIYFQECYKQCPNDQPTEILLNFINEKNCKSPSDWRGFRTLASK